MWWKYEDFRGKKQNMGAKKWSLDFEFCREKWLVPYQIVKPFRSDKTE